jgi:methylphosphotriester-DNA--protein-cysteine methyltransferase
VLEAAEFSTVYLNASVTPVDWIDCRMLVVSPLLRELIGTLDRSASATQGAFPREALLMALVNDEIVRADVQALCVPLSHPRNGGSAAAAASGYASESAFSAMFKNAMGQSPSHFQRQANKVKLSAC